MTCYKLSFQNRDCCFYNTLSYQRTKRSKQYWQGLVGK